MERQQRETGKPVPEKGRKEITCMDIKETNFRKYLMEQADRHPSVQPQDIVKMCYQAAYGAEHLLGDLKGARRYLEEEYAATKEGDMELYENISDSVCRINLAAWKCTGMPLEWLYRLFVASACIRNQGDLFGEYLKEAGRAAAEGSLPFGITDWERYLEEYGNRPLSCSERMSVGQTGNVWEGRVAASQGLQGGGAEDAAAVPGVQNGREERIDGKTGKQNQNEKELTYSPVHHSPWYREAEKPAYRLVDRRYPRLFPVLEKASQLSAPGQPCVIAIDGRAASGKSTMAYQLSKILDAAVIEMDDFFLPPELRTPERYAQPGGNVHYERFQEEVLPFISAPECFSYRIFDCGKMDYNGKCQVGNGRFRIVEGSYSCHPLFGRYASLTVFMDVEPGEQMRRISLRNGEAMAEMFRKKWIPLEEKYIENCAVAENADIRFSYF